MWGVVCKKIKICWGSPKNMREWGGLAKNKNMQGVREKIKICRGWSKKKLKYVGGGLQIFPFRPPPQDLKWNSPQYRLSAVFTAEVYMEVLLFTANTISKKIMSYVLKKIVSQCHSNIIIFHKVNATF